MSLTANPLLEALQRLGFRKWYERQLLGGHAHLVVTVFALLGVLGGFEAYARAAQTPADRLVDLLAIAFSMLIGIWALRQYGQRMAQAEFIANQASCPDCGHYGRWRCLQGNAKGIEVACKDCQRHWRIET